MLAAVALVAGLLGGSKLAAVPENLGCPALPATTIVATTIVSTAAQCPALEVSGNVGQGTVSIDPAFDVSVSAAQLARTTEGNAVLAGFAADGRQLFSLPVAALGAFHVYVPLATAAQQQVARLTLASDRGSAERRAAPGAETGAEIISLSDQRVILAWNANAFPAIRVAESPEKTPIATGSGSSTFEQMTIDTRSRRLYVTFSDGVRSTTRGFTIFGR
jgi:hypothetical protein